ncbi:MAG: pyridoxamine 5'-phosphate oxidase family protein [Candidatus Omnitrophica bacterium]|nr:pyridoxamine 5'-phosphate oxidase family protein [Candidatus Omnitrophota bacterium]
MKKGIVRIIESLVERQSVGVLATYDELFPYCSLVAFAVTGELRKLVFATMRDTRKYANMKTRPHVSMLIDSRTNRAEDFNDAIAVTAIGTASEPNSAERSSFAAVLLAKHPSLRDFLADPDCAVICIDVEKFVLVAHFKEVTEYVPE